MISIGDSLRDYLYKRYLPSRLDISPGAIEQYEIAIRLFERWAGRTLGIHDLDDARLARFLAAYKRTGRSGTTVNRKRTMLLTLWRHAYDADLIDRPPRISAIPRAREPSSPPVAWTPEEVGRILEVAATRKGEIAGINRAQYLVSAFLTFYDTGARFAEVLRIRPVDVDLKNHLVRITSTKTNTVRLCPIHPDTAAAISRILSPDRRTVWPWPHGYKWARTKMHRLCREARVACGREAGGVFHKFRRTSGTLVEANGGDGAKHIGDTRRVFERHYLDPRMATDQLRYLPRPVVPS